jgi:hypothetical protein
MHPALDCLANATVIGKAAQTRGLPKMRALCVCSRFLYVAEHRSSQLRPFWRTTEKESGIVRPTALLVHQGIGELLSSPFRA